MRLFILSTEHNYFLTDDYCHCEDSCQFIIHSNSWVVSMMQKQAVNQRCDAWFTVYVSPVAQGGTAPQPTVCCTEPSDLH